MEAVAKRFLICLVVLLAWQSIGRLAKLAITQLSALPNPTEFLNELLPWVVSLNLLGQIAIIVVGLIVIIIALLKVLVSKLKR